MTRIPALPQDQVRELEQELVAEVLAELRMTVDVVASQLGEVLVAATMPGPGEPWVSETDLAAIPSLWTRVVDGILTPIVRGIWQVGAGWIVAHLSTPAAIADSVVDAYLQGAANRLKGIGQVLWEQARDGLREGIASGETVPQLRERVRRAAEISAPRAEVIARTEALRAHNAASQAQMEALGDPKIVKEWLATNDLRTRPTHRVADGQTVGIFEPFQVGEAFLMQPGDPTGLPQETIQCRCSVAYDFPNDVVLVAADWSPADHPRDREGKFSDLPSIDLPSGDPEAEQTKRSKAVPDNDFPELSVADMDATWDEMTAGNQLSDRQRESLREYTGLYYKLINPYLRGQISKLNLAAQPILDDMRASMRSSTKPMLLHRGTQFKDLGGADGVSDLKKMVGQTWQSSGFFSTSIDKKSSRSERPVLLEIETPKGTPLAWGRPVAHLPDENEVVLGDGLSYQIISVDEVGGQTVVRMRVVI